MSHSHRFKDEKGLHNVTTPKKYAYHFYRDYCKKLGHPYLQYDGFTKVLDRVVTMIADTLIAEGYVNLPCSMGSITIYPYELKPKIAMENGKRIIKGLSNINWGATYKMWKEDSTTKGKVVRFTDYRKYRFKFKPNPRYKAMKKFKYVPTQLLKSRLTEAIENNLINY